MRLLCHVFTHIVRLSGSYHYRSHQPIISSFFHTTLLAGCSLFEGHLYFSIKPLIIVFTFIVQTEVFCIDFKAYCVTYLFVE